MLQAAVPLCSHVDADLDTPSPTHPCTHSLSHSLSHSLAHSLTHSLTLPPTHALTHLHTRTPGAPDGPMLTLTAAVLRLTAPFVSGFLTQQPKFQDLLTRHLSPAYYTTHAARLGAAATEASLSGQRGVAGSSSSGNGSSGLGMMAADPAAAASQASFITEVFFVAQRYMKVGLMPSVHR